MIRVVRIIALIMLAGIAMASAPQQRPTRFVPLVIHIDSAADPLAAWQVDLVVTRGDVRIVSIEGGDAPFDDAPYFDKVAIQSDRAIIAGLHTGDEAPTGRTRIARIHLMIRGDLEPEYKLTLVAAATRDATPITPTASFTTGDGS